MHVDRDAEAAGLRVPVVRRNCYESAFQLGVRLTQGSSLSARRLELAPALAAELS